MVTTEKSVEHHEQSSTSAEELSAMLGEVGVSPMPKGKARCAPKKDPARVATKKLFQGLLGEGHEGQGCVPERRGLVNASY